MILLLLACSLFSLQGVQAQDNEEAIAPVTPGWVSAKGYWVVESNRHNPNDHIVYFYTNDQMLIYKENLKGVVLPLQKRRTKMQLKRALETCMAGWEKDHTVRENEGWVIRRLGGPVKHPAPQILVDEK